MDCRGETELDLWQDVVRRIDGEVRQLPVAERRWIADRLQKVGSLQERMHGCFTEADGEYICGTCQGACCLRGKNHFTLVNLLGFLLDSSYPPMPEFARTCPFLAEDGCTLESSRRPFNCISFLCESIEERLPEATRKNFYRLEGQLRTLYLEFDHRYEGSSLRGLFIRAERMENRPFLGRLSMR